MKKTVPLTLLIILPVLFLAVVYLYVLIDSSDQYSSDSGPLTVEPGKTASLSGPWSFYWDQFLTDTTSAEPDDLVRMPHKWQNFLKDGNSAHEGKATYFIRLDTKSMHGERALYIPAIYSAYRLFINGKFVAQNGVPGFSEEAERPSGKPRIITFSQETDTLEILLQVTNHSKIHSGVSEGSLEYGSPEAVQSRYVILLFGDALLFIVLLVLGIISLYWYLNHQKETQNLIFAVICMLYALRVLWLGRMLIYSLVPFLSVRVGENLLLVVYLLSIPLFLSYCRTSFPDEFPRWAIIAFSIITLGLFITLVCISPGLRLSFLTYYGILILIGGLYIQIGLIIAIRRKRRNAPVVFVASILIVGCGINDILYFSGIFVFMPLMNIGIGIFGCMQVLILGSSSQRSFRELLGVHERLRIIEAWQDAFFSAAAKDIRKPLEGITEISDALLRGSLGPITSDQLGGLSLINAGSLQISNMVSDLLDFRRIREGNIDISRRTVNLYFLVEEVRLSLSLPFREMSLGFHNGVPRDIDEIYTDENLLERVVFNLARGFVVYSSSGSFEVEAEKTDEEIRIRILWKAEGVDHAQVKSAFEVFDMQDKGRDVTLTGEVLALSIAKRLVEIQQGRFLLDGGSEDPISITIVLPVLATGEDEESEEAAAHLDSLINLEPVFEEVVQTRNIDIMVVSNDLMALQVMKSQLASMNYNVIPVTSGDEAVDKIREKCPNMVLLDVYLHKTSGYEVCGRIRENYSSSELPVILITEKDKVTDLMQGLTSGANDFLARPYHMEEFLTRVNTHIQLARINQMYSRFVPTEFLNNLGQENIIDLKLGDQVQREMTVLFVDIRAFTNLSENMTPQENFKFINSYLSRFSPMITRNNGFVDKFIGDAIMALYPGQPEDAIQTALEMVEHVKVYNGHRANCGYNPINIGIGIHTGNLILGIIGDNQRMQGTVISDAVNLASRIQDVTKLYHANIVISQETFVKLENPMSYDFRFLGKVKVKGKAKSVSLFEIFNGDTDDMRKLKSETKNDFETAIILFAKRRFEEAAMIFEDIERKNPGDYASQLFLDRARKFMVAEKKAFLSSL